MELKPWPRQVSILAQLTVTIAIIDREMSLGLYYATDTRSSNTNTHNFLRRYLWYGALLYTRATGNIITEPLLQLIEHQQHHHFPILHF